MKLEKKSLREAEEWKKAGYELPEYDLDIIQANTKKPGFILAQEIFSVHLWQLPSKNC